MFAALPAPGYQTLRATAGSKAPAARSPASRPPVSVSLTIRSYGWHSVGRGIRYSESADGGENLGPSIRVTNVATACLTLRRALWCCVRSQSTAVEEVGVSPARSRHCDRGATLALATTARPSRPRNGRPLTEGLARY